MNNPLRLALIAVLSVYMAGCSSLESFSETEYISPMTNVSLNVGESAIVHGAVDQCGQDSLTWSDITLQLPNPETGFFSNAGRGLIKSKRCGSAVTALKVRFTANKAGSERLTVLGDPMNIVVSNGANFQQPRQFSPENTSSSESTMLPKTSAPPVSTMPAKKTDAEEEEGVLDTLFKWIERDAP